MPSTKTDFNRVREIALALPGVVESRVHGAPSLKVSGRMLACPAIHRSAEPDSIVVWIDPEQRAQLMDADPAIYHVTDHYEPHPTVLVRLERISQEALRDLLELAWCFVSSRAKAKTKRTGARGKKPR